MNIRTSELTRWALTWAYMKAMGFEDQNDPKEHTRPEEALGPHNWTMVGKGGRVVWLNEATPPLEPLLANHLSNLGLVVGSTYAGMWEATHPDGQFELGDTPLMAAVRCLVANKLGDTVDVPDELVTTE